MPFRDFDSDDFAVEARERWGSTDAFAESTRRTDAHTSEDWKRQRSESDDLSQRFLALLDTGVAAESEEVAVLVDAHRGHISNCFYECTPKIHASLGAVYTDDERFRANINNEGERLADQSTGTRSFVSSFDFVKMPSKPLSPTDMMMLIMKKTNPIRMSAPEMPASHM